MVFALRTVFRSVVFLSNCQARRKLNYRVMSDPQTISSQNGLHERRKRTDQDNRSHKRQKTHKPKPVQEGSSEQVLLADVQAILSAQTSDSTDPLATTVGNSPELPEPFTEIEVKILELSSTGDGLGKGAKSDHLYVVPFTVPGDTVAAKVIKHFSHNHYSLADFVRVIQPSPLRDDDRIGCKYFAACSGCQFQMLDYSEQLKHKKSIIAKAYRNFSGLSREAIPIIQETMGSPLQYGYRTKLTPHFDGPPGYRSRVDRKAGVKKVFEEMPPMGFMQKGQRKTLDIEDCPIGTDAVRMGMKLERARVTVELSKYKKGATILLRESTKRVPTSSTEEGTLPIIPQDTIVSAQDIYTDYKTCITNNNASSTEYIDSFTFTNPAGSFFQNNNSILPNFTQYIRDNILPPEDCTTGAPKVQHLIDAYCGSGLFTITLSSLFSSSMGIDISSASIEYAKKNAELNNVPPARAAFLAADAPELFKSVTYDPDETVVVIDPPRKGCDDNFLNQLLTFRPRRVVYVSCNVHTQARDIGTLVRGRDSARYKIVSLKGFDFFPQTGHVEGVAVLDRVD